MRLTDEDIRETIEAMKQDQGNVLDPDANFQDRHLDRRGELARQGDPGARLVIFKVFRRLRRAPR